MDRLRPALQPQEPRQRRSVDVGVEHADLQADRLQPERQVDRRRRLADAALAGSDGDDRVDRPAPPAWPPRPAHGQSGRRPRLRPGAAGPAFRGQRHQGLRDSGQVEQRPLRRLRAKAPARRALSAGTVMERITLPPEIITSEIMPRLTMSPERSGPLTRFSASRTCSLLTSGISLPPLLGVPPQPPPIVWVSRQLSTGFGTHSHVPTPSTPNAPGLRPPAPPPRPAGRSGRGSAPRSGRGSGGRRRAWPRGPRRGRSGRRSASIRRRCA